MAFSWHYPRWRRVLLQAALWVIFAGIMALAAWVVHSRNSAASHEPVQFRLIERP